MYNKIGPYPKKIHQFLVLCPHSEEQERKTGQKLTRSK